MKELWKEWRGGGGREVEWKEEREGGRKGGWKGGKKGRTKWKAGVRVCLE